MRLGGAERIHVRSDISCTLFLSEPDEYDGGELIVSDSYGEHVVKLPAGDMLLYPASSLHQVKPVTRGARLASFFWVQSMVRDDGQRRMLFEMDTSRSEEPPSELQSLMRISYAVFRLKTTQQQTEHRNTR